MEWDNNNNGTLKKGEKKRVNAIWGDVCRAPGQNDEGKKKK